MDPLGGGSKSMQAGRLLAVLWLFCASLAMQVIVVGQSVSGRAATGGGGVAAPDSGSSDRPAVRQISRAAALPDLRFTGERSDGKSTTGGDPVSVLPLERIAFPAHADARPVPLPRAEIASGALLRSERIRAPPPSIAVL
ncbi:hypothetical protein M728_000207 [Ensifer sp. WSM1721]|uniref:hypothetical protein n=1 Tax=Ensifer sp. WSM1721 TaxID=1041159 RepID=UPI00047C528D|nr:hypothetical protein [Ensifer sp. WSM1721]